VAEGRRGFSFSISGPPPLMRGVPTQAAFQMSTISRLLGRAQPPDSYERWADAVIPEFAYLRAGRPDAPDVDKLKKWLKSFARWKAGYEGFLALERSLGRRGRPVEQRTYEYYVALLLQSGQWHAALLLMVKDIAEPQRAKQLAELDQALAELRKRIKSL
jgi:hypothetical protein